jgi:hypothetical protein
MFPKFIKNDFYCDAYLYCVDLIEINENYFKLRNSLHVVSM